jgi:hypothetical protein
MKGAYGYASYGVQSGFGTPSAAGVAMGTISRVTVNASGGMEAIKTVGQLAPAEIAEGKTSVDISLDLASVQDPHFLQKAKQVVGVGLPWLTFKVGYKRGAVNIYSVISDCKIGSLNLKLEAGGGLTASLTAKGILRTLTAGDPGVMPFLSARSYRWYNAVWSEARDLYGLDFTVNNNLTEDYVIAGSGTALSPLRGPVTIDEGSEDLTGTLRYVLASASFDVQDCILTSGNQTLTFTTCDDVSPQQVMTLQLNGLKQTGDSWEVPADGNIVASSPFMLTGWDLTG